MGGTEGNAQLKKKTAVLKSQETKRPDDNFLVEQTAG